MAGGEAVVTGLKDEPPNMIAEQVELPQHDVPEKQAELIILQAQQEGIERTFQALNQSLQDAAKHLKGESWARKINSALGMIDQYEDDLKTVSREIKLYLTVPQMSEQFKRDFAYSHKIQNFKQEILTRQMEYYKDFPQSPSKPQNMVVIPTKIPVEDSKLVKLPTQQLPVFSGEYSNWTSFLDSFESMVGCKTNISEPAKLGFLKSALRGDARSLIMRLENNNSGNYARAMKILAERYQNTRAIVRAHLDAIINAPIVKADNSIHLRKYIQCVEDNLDGLRQTGVSTTNWGPILAYHMYQKLDNDTRKDFEVAFPGSDVQKISELTKFLKERAAALETYSSTGKKPQQDLPKPKPATGGAYTGQQQASGGRTSEVFNKQQQCVKCAGSHQIYKCEDFKAFTPEQKERWVREQALCRNCLRRGHTAVKCPSRYTCKICHKRHSTLMHFSEPGGGSNDKTKARVHHVTAGPVVMSPLPTPTSAATCTTVPIQLQVTVTPAATSALPVTATTPSTPAAGKSQTLYAVGVSGAGYQVSEEEHFEHTPLLGTATTPVRSAQGEIVHGRALLDSGSHLNFITDLFATRLGFAKTASKCTVHTIGAVQPSATVGSVTFSIVTPDGHHLPITAHILTKVTGILPMNRIITPHDFSPQRINLADTKFHVPGKVDLLLGCEIYEELMLGEKIKVGKLTATSSRLGWVITGTATKAIKKDVYVERSADPFTVGHVRLQDDAYDIDRVFNKAKGDGPREPRLAYDPSVPSEESAHRQG